MLGLLLLFFPMFLNSLMSVLCTGLLPPSRNPVTSSGWYRVAYIWAVGEGELDQEQQA